MKVITIIMIAGAMSIVASAAVADGKNWSSEKSAKIKVNRESNAGIGNGGERYFQDDWQATLYGEDGPMDRDPGGSEGMNQSCSDEGLTATYFMETSC